MASVRNFGSYKDPGRGGEIIKNEEIDNEFSRRYIEYKKSNELELF
jgi:hypothetical protein